MLFDSTAQCCGYGNKNSGKNWKVPLKTPAVCFRVIKYLDIIDRAKYLDLQFLSGCLAPQNNLCQSLFFSKKCLASAKENNIVYPLKNKARTCKDLQESSNLWPHSLNEKHQCLGWLWLDLGKLSPAPRSLPEAAAAWPCSGSSSAGAAGLAKAQQLTELISNPVLFH